MTNADLSITHYVLTGHTGALLTGGPALGISHCLELCWLPGRTRVLQSHTVQEQLLDDRHILCLCHPVRWPLATCSFQVLGNVACVTEGQNFQFLFDCAGHRWLVATDRGMAALERVALTTKCPDTLFPVRAHWPELFTWLQQAQGGQEMPSHHAPEFGERGVFGKQL